jgi:peroxiredoxin
MPERSLEGQDNQLGSQPSPNLDPSVVSQVLARSLTQAGKSIAELSAEAPVLLIFLRHSGCSFCRETLADVAAARPVIERHRARIVLVHMADAIELDRLITKYGLAGVDRICDPLQQLYDVFGLKRGTIGQLFGWKVLTRGIFDGVVRRHGIDLAHADASQLPGVFLVDRSEIVRRFRHRSAADRPDYASLCAKSSGERSLR